MVAAAAGVSQAMVSSVERGHADRWLLAHVIAIPAALDARAEIDLRWRAGELDRLLDADHAALAATMSRTLTACGWELRFEVTYAVYGARGSIDVLAWHASTRTLLVIEIKTEVTSAESTIRKLDEKVRLASQIVRERFGWRAAVVARVVVVEDTTTARRRIRAARLLFDAAFPLRGVATRQWLRSPRGQVSALMFLPSSSTATAIPRRGGRHRVRIRSADAPPPDVNVASRRSAATEPQVEPTILTNRT